MLALVSGHREPYTQPTLRYAYLLGTNGLQVDPGSIRHVATIRNSRIHVKDGHAHGLGGVQHPLIETGELDGLSLVLQEVNCR